MRKRTEYLNKHPYKIWQGKDKKWYTYLPHSEKGRVMAKRVSKKALEDVIIEYVREEEENPTLEELFKEWADSKLAYKEITIPTYQRYYRDFDKYFGDSKKVRVKKVDEYWIENFIKTAVVEHELSQKRLCNLKTTIKGIFQLAKKKKLVTFSISSVLGDISISKTLLHKPVHDEDAQVFKDDEKPIVIKHLTDNPDMLNLGLLLMFNTGMRVGELCTLTWADVTGNTIHVHRTESVYQDAEGHMVYDVKESPKTEAGDRDVILPDSAMWILKKLRHLNPFGNFMFEQNQKRMRAFQFRNRLRLVCDKVKIVPKSPHKIRRTYGTNLIDQNVPEGIIIKQMGHTNIQCTRQYYYYSTKTTEQTVEEINRAVAF